MAVRQPKPVVIMSSVLAGLNVFVAGTAFVSEVPDWVSGLSALLVASTTVGWGAYVHNQVTPYAQVAARRLPSGDQVAGPAAPGVTQEGDIVDVVKAEEAHW
jgi:hypothetical protein